MDDAGIDYTVLSLPTPHIHHGDDSKSLQAAEEINDELALLKSDRFGWTACLPLPYVFGSDYPHSPAKVILMKKKNFDRNPKWDGAREKIYSGNGLAEHKETI